MIFADDIATLLVSWLPAPYASMLVHLGAVAPAFAHRLGDLPDILRVEMHASRGLRGTASSETMKVHVVCSRVYQLLTHSVHSVKLVLQRDKLV